MSITVKKITLSEQPSLSDGKLITDNTLGLIGQVEVHCTVRLGTLNMTVAELSKLKQGQCLQLEQKTHEPVELLLNNHVIARGELMCCDEHFAIQITEFCG